MDSTKVTKVPALMEDFDCGTELVKQQRAGQEITGKQIDLHYAVDSEDNLRKVDITKYAYAKIGELAYRFDANAVAGIPSDYGPGYWNISALPAKGVEMSDDTSVEDAVEDLRAKVQAQSDAVGSTKKLFSAKIVKSAGGWVLEDSNKVVSVREETVLGASLPTLILTFDKVPVSLTSVDMPGFNYDSVVRGNELELVLLHNLSGKLTLDSATLDLDSSSVWSSLVTAAADPTTGVITISHPDSANTTLNKPNPFYTSGVVSKCEAGSTRYEASATVKDANAARIIEPLAPFSVEVEYDTVDLDFTMHTINLGIDAVKGGEVGTVAVSHPDLRVRPSAQADDDGYLAKVGVSGTLQSIVTLFNFSGAKKTVYDEKTKFHLVSPSLVPSKPNYPAKLNFDFGPVVVPPSSFNVGFSFYVVGLIEA